MAKRAKKIDLPRAIVEQPKALPAGMLGDNELANLRELIIVLQTHVERLIDQQANTVKDMAEMRKELFLTSLAEGMKNKKQLKKKAKKKNRLLEKCGVKTRKVTLSENDVARIKSRVAMVA